MRRDSSDLHIIGTLEMVNLAKDKLQKYEKGE